MSTLKSLLILVTLPTTIAAMAACAEPTPIPGPLCGDQARPEYCKEACAADALCPGHDQQACELDCRACRTDENYCPADPQ